MNGDSTLDALCDLCGILPRYHDLQGQERITTLETQKALLRANGFDVTSDATIHETLSALRHELENRWFPQEIIIESNKTTPLDFGLGAAWEIHLDDQDTVVAEGRPADHITLPALKSGVYVLTASVSGRIETVTVIVAPKRLPQVQSLTQTDRLWGLNFALYGIRSDRNTGLGDFEDLAEMSEIAGTEGAAFVGINPIHNMGYFDKTAISPYSPSHRGFLNTSYIAIDQIPGLEGGAEPLAFDELRRAVAVQYHDHKHTHNAALETLFGRFQAEADTKAQNAFARFVVNGGAELQTFAQFEVLSKNFGTDWRDWPNDPAVPPKEQLGFHMWLQWVADTQLGRAQTRAVAAGMPLGLYLDLAVGPRRDGAESWCERDTIAQGVSVGAPPDHLSPEGQNWDLAAFAPRKLQAQRYAPLRRILSQTMHHAGVIRIDHVLGLNRSFWLPDDGSPGAYIRKPFEALLAVIKIEAERHNCLVIGEDLGLVPDGFRDTMRGHGFYGYSVLQYERDDHGGFRDPHSGAEQVLSCFATHDTPTVNGFATGRDIDWWAKLGWIDAPEAKHAQARRHDEITAIAHDGDFRTHVHTLLARSNAALVAVQLDDVLGSVEAQNLPGTIDEHPNWRRKYTSPLEGLAHDDRLTATASIMRDAARHNSLKGVPDED
ncbi:4-alpha-glucanotransferase [Sulfitobacter sp. SK011]|uniref:4-alpha-glucanotransferase n=1 Tax=Sulfitobacter sp. SK011 TaxID=1389004 RepID=UPI000E0BB623|nr:4-alpha-glucanotransferase [Sulfitobacter sp. SK011]AXI40585.1 4-alpha-glucanotransferase [Sulfitobacter sp. SK011]